MVLLIFTNHAELFADLHSYLHILISRGVGRLRCGFKLTLNTLHCSSQDHGGFGNGDEDDDEDFYDIDNGNDGDDDDKFNGR